MKRIFITLTIACFSVLSFAQPAPEADTVINDSVAVKTAGMDRIAKLENDVKELKASNEILQKQIAELRNQLQVKKKKLTVSRTGSKQPVWIED
jgi:peptidoglycan hydrolase CwlO-like protein